MWTIPAQRNVQYLIQQMCIGAAVSTVEEVDLRKQQTKQVLLAASGVLVSFHAMKAVTSSHPPANHNLPLA
jgi:hypothetical protein